MTEEEAKNWVYDRFGSMAHYRVDQFLDLLRHEGAKQNLVAPSTMDTLWARHVVDSAQLLHIAPANWQSWIDIGSGGGFPGIVIAILAPDCRMTLTEPRRKRAEFLQHCIMEIRLLRAEVRQSRIELIVDRHDVISARAVAPVGDLLHGARGCAHTTTRWLLPRGQIRKADEELLSGLTRSMFHVEQSITDRHSAILVIDGDGG